MGGNQLVRDCECGQAEFLIVREIYTLDSVRRNMITMYPELDLDLGFHPVSCEQPEAFTQDQIDQYNEVGYISPIRLFEGEELDDRSFVDN